MIEIINRFTGKIICEDETIRIAAERNKANLYGANLGGANLRRADLRGDDLGWADLRSDDLEVD